MLTLLLTPVALLSAFWCFFLFLCVENQGDIHKVSRQVLCLLWARLAGQSRHYSSVRSVPVGADPVR